MAEHRPVHIMIIFLSFIAMLTTILFHYSATFQIRNLLQIPEGWYKSNASTLYETYKLPITPSDWTEYVWLVIFAAQVLWLAYALTLLCRKTPDKRVYLYDQGFMPIWLFVFFLLALVCHLSGIFAYDRNQQIATTFMYLLLGGSLIAALVFSYSNLYHHGAELLRSGLELDVTLTRALVQNGLSMYMGWSGFRFCVSLAVNLVHENGLSPKDASTIGLGVLLFVIALYAIVDVLVRSKYMCYTFAAYLIGMVGLIGILAEHYVAWERNSVLTCIILALTLLAFGIKVATTMWRWRTCPEPIACSEEMAKALASEPPPTAEKPPPLPFQQPFGPPPEAVYPWFQPQPVYYMLPQPDVAYQPEPVYEMPAQPAPQVQAFVVPAIENQIPANPQVQPIVYQTTPAGGWTTWVS